LLWLQAIEQLGHGELVAGERSGVDRPHGEPAGRSRRYVGEAVVPRRRPQRRKRTQSMLWLQAMEQLGGRGRSVEAVEF
jgi:hypothetical protein